MSPMGDALKDQLKLARTRRKMRQRDIAEAVGWSNHTPVSHIEKGLNSTTFDHAEKWAQATDHTILVVPNERLPAVRAALLIEESKQELFYLLAEVLATANDMDRTLVEGQIKMSIRSTRMERELAKQRAEAERPPWRGEWEEELKKEG